MSDKDYVLAFHPKASCSKVEGQPRAGRDALWIVHTSKQNLGSGWNPRQAWRNAYMMIRDTFANNMECINAALDIKQGMAKPSDFPLKDMYGNPVKTDDNHNR